MPVQSKGLSYSQSKLHCRVALCIHSCMHTLSLHVASAARKANAGHDESASNCWYRVWCRAVQASSPRRIAMSALLAAAGPMFRNMSRATGTAKLVDHSDLFLRMQRQIQYVRWFIGLSSQLETYDGSR